MIAIRRSNLYMEKPAYKTELDKEMLIPTFLSSLKTAALTNVYQRTYCVLRYNT